MKIRKLLLGFRNCLRHLKNDNTEIYNGLGDESHDSEVIASLLEKFEFHPEKREEILKRFK